MIDRGFPPDNNVLPDAEFGDLAGVRTAPLLRLEVLMQDLTARYPSLDAVLAMPTVRLSPMFAPRATLALNQSPRIVPASPSVPGRSQRSRPRSLRPGARW